MRYLIAEVHNTYGGRHAYLVPVNGERAAWVTKAVYVSPFHPVAGRYRIRAPRPRERLDVTISLHIDNQPTFVAAVRGRRRPATATELLRLQLVAPLASLMGALSIRAHGIWLWLRRVPVVPRDVKVHQP